MKKRLMLNLIKQICQENNIGFSSISYDYIFELTKNNKTKRIIDTTFELNTNIATMICNDKYATFEVLNKYNIPVIQHRLYHDPNNLGKYIINNITQENIQEMLDKYLKIIIKPIHGQQGRDVFLCDNIIKAKNILDKYISEYEGLTICPFYDIKEEYRTFYLDGKCYLTYGKVRPFIVGDGISTIGNLIKQKQIEEYTIDEKMLDNILNKDEKLEVSFKHNLSNGATVEMIEDSILIDKIQKLSISAAKAVDIKFATIDVIKTNDNELLVLEINPGVCVNKFVEQIDWGYDFAKKLYTDAILKMLELK